MRQRLQKNARRRPRRQHVEPSDGAACHELQALWLSDTKVADLTPLAGKARLWDLWLSNSQVTSLEALGDLEALRWLRDLEDVWVEDETRRRALAASLGDDRVVKVWPQLYGPGECRHHARIVQDVGPVNRQRLSAT
jgi:hypothetical protein